MAAKKKTKYMAKGGKTSKYMAKGGKTSKYMAKGGKTTKGMAKGGAMKKSKGMARGGMKNTMNARDTEMMARGMRMMANGGKVTAAQRKKLPPKLVALLDKKAGKNPAAKKKPMKKATRMA